MFRDSTVGYLRSPSSASCTVSFSETQTASKTFLTPLLVTAMACWVKAPELKTSAVSSPSWINPGLDVLDLQYLCCPKPCSSNQDPCSERWYWLGWGGTSLGVLWADLEMEAGSNSLRLVLGQATDSSSSSQLLLVSCPVQLGSPLLSKESEPYFDTIDVPQDSSQ